MRLTILFLLFSLSASAQFIKTPGKYNYSDSLMFSKFKNNLAGDYVLSTDTSGKLRLRSGLDTTPDWYDLKIHGGDNTGSSDVSALVQAAINAGYKSIYFRAGTWKINTTIQMKDGVTIVGDGGQSVIKTTSDTTIFKCSISLGGNQCSFENIVLRGTYTTVPPSIGTTSNQIGILVDSAQNITIRDSRFTNFKGCGVRMLNNAYCCAIYVPNAGKSNMVHNSTFDSSYTGLDFGPRAEYNNVTGCVFGTNYYALTVSAGNCRIDNNSIVNNMYGMYITQTSNGGHGVATGNTSNHNDICLYINGVTNGFSFVNNVFARKMDGGLTVLEIMNSTNIKFIGGIAVSNDTVRTTNCTNISFIDQAYLSGDYRYVNVSGQPPTVIRNGIVPNTMSMKDVVNNKQFDLTHTNGSVGLTINGAVSSIKVGIGTNSPDSTLTSEGSIYGKAGLRLPNLPASGTYNKTVGVASDGTFFLRDTTAVNGVYLPLSGGTLTGNLLFSADNTKDIGASGATRPRNIYAAGIVTASGVQSATAQTSSYFQTLGGIFIDGNGAASNPSTQIRGTWYTGGTATTTKPQLLIEPTGTTSTAWSTSGTGLGINAASGFTGNLLDLQISSSPLLRVSQTGGNTTRIDAGSRDISIMPGTNKMVGIYTTSPTSTLTVNGSLSSAIVSKSADYTATALDNTILVTVTGKTITLPTAVGCSGREYVIKLTVSGTGTVATTSSQTIDGSTTYSLSAQWKYVHVKSDGANWIIIGNN